MVVAAKPIKSQRAKYRGADEAVLAQRDRALDLLEQLVALVPVSSMQTHAAQESLHGANALLAQLGRGRPDDRAVICQAWLDAPERKR